MASNALIKTIEEQNFLEQMSATIQPAVNNAFEATGSAGRGVKNFLHGKWLGHPLHPVLTDIPVGAWTAALVLDAMEAGGREEYGPGADAAIAVGLAGAVGSAITGLTDWSTINGRARRLGLAHGLLNASATILYTTSLVLRRQKSRRAGRGFALLGYAVSGIAAYFGGHLVYDEQIGVKRTPHEMPDEEAPIQIH